LNSFAIHECFHYIAAGKPVAIGIDWMSNVLFISLENPDMNMIAVTNLEGEYFTSIIQGTNDLKNVNSIAVNPMQGQIYWPDGSTKGEFTIQVANMDGSKRNVLTNNRLNPDLEHPMSLSYDFQDNRLYWLNYNTVKIQYYDFVTSQVNTINFGALKPNIITVYKNSVYFAAEAEGAILHGDKTDGGHFEYVRTHLGMMFCSYITYYSVHRIRFCNN